MKICPKCGGIAYYDSYHRAYVCTRSDCDYWEPKRPTNYERLISKSPEEMVEWLSRNIVCARCPVSEKCGRYSSCESLLSMWLKEETEDA